MRLAILGGTSKLAESFTQQVLHHGYDVSSLIPHNAAPSLKHGNLTTVHGLWEDESDVQSLVSGCHAVICMPEVQHNAEAMAALVVAAYQAGIQRVIVVTDVLRDVADHAHLPAAKLLQQTTLDWTIVHAGQAWNDDFIAPLHDVAAFVVRQISDMTHLSETVLVRS